MLSFQFVFDINHQNVFIGILKCDIKYKQMWWIKNDKKIPIVKTHLGVVFYCKREQVQRHPGA